MKNLIFLLTILITSCTYQQDDRILNWKSEFVMQDGKEANGYYKEHENFIKPYFSADYKTDTLIVTTLIEINSCAEIVADIKISNDTLFLLTKTVGNFACASVTFNKFTYTIYNPDNKEFIIKSEK